MDDFSIYLLIGILLASVVALINVFSGDAAPTPSNGLALVVLAVVWPLPLLVVFFAFLLSLRRYAGGSKG